MKKYVLSIGLLDKETKRQELPQETALAIIADNSREILGGATIITGCIGVYTHADGSQVVEPSIQVVAYDAERSDVIRLAKTLARALNQECIAMETSEIESAFIGA